MTQTVKMNELFSPAGLALQVFCVQIGFYMEQVISFPALNYTNDSI